MNPLESFPLRSDQDVAIVMHREVHFGGSFDVMIEYYERGGKGVCQEFELKQIKALAELEKQLEENIAPLVLTGPDAEKVAEAKDAYKKLKDLYEDQSLATLYPRLIADLILSENENPEEEIAAIVKEKSAIVPAILRILRSENLYDPLFPGYGFAPGFAAKCLGQIGDKRAIISLFNQIGEGDYFDEAIAIESLKLIGDPAKEFLLHVVHGTPYNTDNERAAIALLSFKEDPDVQKVCSDLLKKPEVKKIPTFAAYLSYVCDD